jgi:hypothetical protein
MGGTRLRRARFFPSVSLGLPLVGEEGGEMIERYADPRAPGRNGPR